VTGCTDVRGHAGVRGCADVRGCVDDPRSGWPSKAQNPDGSKSL